MSRVSLANSSLFRSHQATEKNINFVIGKDRFRRSRANYRKKCDGQRRLLTVTKMFGQALVRCQTLTNATLLRWTRFNPFFPALLASVSRNWLRTPRSDLFQRVYVTMISAFQLFFGGSRLVSSRSVPSVFSEAPAPAFLNWKLAVFRYFRLVRRSLPLVSFCFIQRQSSLRGPTFLQLKGIPLRLSKFAGRNGTRLGSMRFINQKRLITHIHRAINNSIDRRAERKEGKARRKERQTQRNASNRRINFINERFDSISVRL